MYRTHTHCPYVRVLAAFTPALEIVFVLFPLTEPSLTGDGECENKQRARPLSLLEKRSLYPTISETPVWLATILKVCSRIVRSS